MQAAIVFCVKYSHTAEQHYVPEVEGVEQILDEIEAIGNKEFAKLQATLDAKKTDTSAQ